MDAYEKLEKIGEGTYGKVREKGAKFARARVEFLRATPTRKLIHAALLSLPAPTRSTKRAKSRPAAWWR